MSSQHVIVIGGGAAGMVAAIAAARFGARVTLLERMSRVGRKLLATGNGRCNYANLRPDPVRFHGEYPEFVRCVFEDFDASSILAFFGELGIEPLEESEGRVFPASQQASSVLDVLRFEMEQRGVEIHCDTNIHRVERDAETGAFLCATPDGRSFTADRVVLAAGGKSAPNLGSNGGGFKIAAALGHTLIDPFPALVQIQLNAPFLKQIDGLKFDGLAEAYVEGRPVLRERGELLFTPYGLSGLPALALSRVVADPRHAGRAHSIRIDPFPDWDEADLTRQIEQRLKASPAKTLEFSFVGLLHKRLIPVLLHAAGIENLQIPCGDCVEEIPASLAAAFKNWRIACTGTQSWMHSQVTAGGVRVKEVHPRTMESRLIPGLYFAGEVLDIDGDSGGFNLSWAWASGHVAGSHAAGYRAG